MCRPSWPQGGFTAYDQSPGPTQIGPVLADFARRRRGRGDLLPSHAADQSWPSHVFPAKCFTPASTSTVQLRSPIIRIGFCVPHPVPCVLSQSTRVYHHANHDATAGIHPNQLDRRNCTRFLRRPLLSRPPELQVEYFPLSWSRSRRHLGCHISRHLARRERALSLILAHTGRRRRFLSIFNPTVIPTQRLHNKHPYYLAAKQPVSTAVATTDRPTDQ